MKTHLYIPGSDFYQCGIAGPKFVFTKEASETTCKNCLKTVDRIDGEWHVLCKWTSHCSGCTEVPECTSAPERGSGCFECGYTGKIRHYEWLPLYPDRMEKAS